MIPLLLAGALQVAAAGSGMAPEEAPEIDTVSWKGSLGAAASVEIDNPRGDVRLRGVDGEEVELVAKLQRLGPPARRAEVDVTPAGDRLRVRVRVPEGPRGRFEDRVDLVVLVPRRAAVAAHAGFGRLEARGLGGRLEASTDSGDLALDLAAAASVRSVSGRIEAQLARGALAAGVELSSGAGVVRAELARDAAGRIEVRTRDRVLFDIALPFRRAPAAGAVRGRVGEGPGHLAIEAGGEVQVLWARAAGGAAGARP